MLKMLITQLTSGDALALSAEGLGGVGKTTLAVALAHQQTVLNHLATLHFGRTQSKAPDHHFLQDQHERWIENHGYLFNNLTREQWLTFPQSSLVPYLPDYDEGRQLHGQPPQNPLLKKEENEVEFQSKLLINTDLVSKEESETLIDMVGETFQDPLDRDGTLLVYYTDTPYRYEWS